MKKLGYILIIAYITALCCLALMTACHSTKQLREGHIKCHIDTTTIHRCESVIISSICRQSSLDSFQFFIDYRVTDSIHRDSAGREISKITHGFISGSTRRGNVTTRELQGSTKKMAAETKISKQELIESGKKTMRQQLADRVIFTLYILIIIVLLSLFIFKVISKRR